MVSGMPLNDRLAHVVIGHRLPRSALRGSLQGAGAITDANIGLPTWVVGRCGRSSAPPPDGHTFIVIYRRKNPEFLLISVHLDSVSVSQQHGAEKWLQIVTNCTKRPASTVIFPRPKWVTPYWDPLSRLPPGSLVDMGERANPLTRRIVGGQPERVQRTFALSALAMEISCQPLCMSGPQAGETGVPLHPNLLSRSSHSHAFSHSPAPKRLPATVHHDAGQHCPGAPSVSWRFERRLLEIAC